MNDKKKICGQIARRCQKTAKKGRGRLLDEYTVTLGYNRDIWPIASSPSALRRPPLPEKRQLLRGAEKRRCGAENRGV
jgi:hypothetical protein